MNAERPAPFCVVTYKSYKTKSNKEMVRFSSTTNKAIGNYVYLLVDPRDNTIFYVGKGKGNRVFSHEEHVKKLISKAVTLQRPLSAKEYMIQEIIHNGKKVLKYIVRIGLTKDEAFVVESVIINLLGSSEMGDIKFAASLTNIQCGHGMRKNGLMTVEEVESLYGVKPLTRRMIKHNLLCININRLYDSDLDIYNATRSSWVLKPERANKCDYVASEYQGVIKALFVVNEKGWYQCGDPKDRRFQFDGTCVTEPKILDLYINKRIEKSSNGKRPSRNPIRYILK